MAFGYTQHVKPTRSLAAAEGGRQAGKARASIPTTAATTPCDKVWGDGGVDLPGVDRLEKRSTQPQHQGTPAPG